MRDLLKSLLWSVAACIPFVLFAGYWIAAEMYSTGRFPFVGIVFLPFILGLAAASSIGTPFALIAGLFTQLLVIASIVHVVRILRRRHSQRS